MTGHVLHFSPQRCTAAHVMPLCPFLASWGLLLHTSNHVVVHFQPTGGLACPAHCTSA